MNGLQVSVGIDVELLQKVTSELITILSNAKEDRIDLKKIMKPWSKRWEDFRFCCFLQGDFLSSRGWELERNWKDGILVKMCTGG
jgi:hypothetical protein